MKISKTNDQMCYQCENANDELIIDRALALYAQQQWEKAQQPDAKQGHWLYVEGIRQTATDIYLMDELNVEPVTAERIA